MTPTDDNGRQQWLDGAPSGEDDFSRYADRGRAELDEQTAKDLLKALDDNFRQRFPDAVADPDPAAATSRPTATVRRLPRRQWWGVAALLVAGLLGAAWWLLRPAPSVQFADHFVPYPNDLVPRSMGEADRPDSLLLTALLPYDRREYAAAAAALGRLLEAAPAYGPDTLNRLRLYRAASLLGAEQPEAALRQLTPLQGGPLREAATWYSGLSLIALDRPDEALAVLQPLANTPASPYQARAHALCQQLSP